MKALCSLFLNDHKEMYEPERAAGLRSYRYRGIDKSPISKYILTPYWIWAVGFLPPWMAPNLVTLLGFLFMIAAYAVVLWRVPDLQGSGRSPMLYLFFAACFWVYSTMDNIDGKQARRTNSSSPLGELFDHGCDALNCPIGSFIQIAALGLGFGNRALVIMFMSCWAFFLPTWEEYHTGILYLGYINGPTEGLLSVITTILVSAVFGPAVWFTQVSLFGVYSVYLVDLTLAAFVALFLLYYVPSCLWTVKAECARKGTSFLSALFQLFPMALGTLCVALWLSSPFSIVQSRNFVLFFSTIGIVFGKMATKIIYAHVAKCPFPLYTGMMLPLVFGSVLMALAPFVLPEKFAQDCGTAETTFLWTYLSMCIIGYSNWIYHTIHSICLHCDIYCFKIKPKESAESLVKE
jgi:ethanolaminephosphotransferase